jgi:hypothetical protein
MQPTKGTTREASTQDAQRSRMHHNYCKRVDLASKDIYLCCQIAAKAQPRQDHDVRIPPRAYKAMRSVSISETLLVALLFTHQYSWLTNIQ